MNIRIALSLFVALVLTACQKDRWLSDDEVAEEVETALVANQGGLANELSLKAAYAASSLDFLPCDTVTTVTRDYTFSSDSRTADYTYTWDITKQCGVNETVVSWTSTFSGNYDFPRVSGSTSGTRSWVMTQLEPQYAAWLLNGSSSRSGSHESKVRRRRSFDSSIETTFTNIVVDKLTREWMGGTGVSNIILTGENGGSYTAVATFTINTDRTVTVLINGNTYTFSLYS